eukprot:m.365696 g.365696  ORF g.365696 m.365696 type:complete len:57 (+) comp32621_c0_seq1:88-258(+)
MSVVGETKYLKVLTNYTCSKLHTQSLESKKRKGKRSKGERRRERKKECSNFDSNKT